MADPSDRNLLLSQLKEAVSCQIEFWDSIYRLEELIDFECDPTFWVQAVAVEVVTPEELTMKDVDNFLPELRAIVSIRKNRVRAPHTSDASLEQEVPWAYAPFLSSHRHDLCAPIPAYPTLQPEPSRRPPSKLVIGLGRTAWQSLRFAPRLN